jgi:phage gpG-like protein
MKKTPSEILKDKLATALRELPRELGHEGVKFWQSNFDKQEFQDVPPIKWAAPKRTSSHKTLQVTGRLRRNIRLIAFNEKQIKWGNDVPYAAAHNIFSEENRTVKSHSRRSKLGKTFTVNSYNFTAKPRPFMGESKSFNRFASKLIKNYLQKNKIIK